MSIKYKSKHLLGEALLKEVKENELDQLSKSLDQTFQAIGEEFKTLKNNKVLAFILNLSELEQEEIINKLK